VGVTTSTGELRASTVVVAAGAYGSPGILLRSGIGPERELPVGDGLSDHVGVGFGFEGTERLQHEAEEFEQGAPALHGSGNRRPGEQRLHAGPARSLLFPAIDPPGGHGYEASVAVFAMKPASRGSVRLNSPRASRRFAG